MSTRRHQRDQIEKFSAQLASAALKGDKSLTELAEQFEVQHSQVSTWKALP